MTISSAKVLVPPLVHAPPAAQWAATLVQMLRRAGLYAWRAMEESGQRRAQRELHRLTGPAAPASERTRLLREALHPDSSA